MRSATPASAAYFRAIAVVASFTSQLTSDAPGGSASAIAIDDQPVNVPISTTRRGCWRVTRNERNAPSSLPTIIPACTWVAFVSSSSRSNTAACAVVYRSAYASISSGMNLVIGRRRVNLSSGETSLMPPLQISTDEFRVLAERLTALAADFLAGLDNRQTVSPTSAAGTRAFELPLPEEGVGEAVLRDLESVADHVRAPTGRRL